MGNTNAAVLESLFRSLDCHDHAAMAACYHPEATFRDIAFHLHGRKEIHAMWHMICEGDIRVTFDVIEVNNEFGHLSSVDNYTFSSTGRRVRNVIDSRFRFQDGTIIEQQDDCDARAWAKMALGGVKGFLAGRLQFLRAFMARRMLQSFLAKHPEYL